jgi:AraC-like DNA-binding protein
MNRHDRSRCSSPGDCDFASVTPLLSPSRSLGGSVPGAAVTVLLEALEAIGGDAQDALRNSDLIGLANDFREGRVKELSRAQFARFAQECVSVFDRHCYCRDPRPHFSPRRLRMLCLTALACPTLELAIKAAIEFHTIAMNDATMLKLRVENGMATFGMNMAMRQRGVGDLVVTMYGLTAFHRVFGWLIGDEIRLAEVTLSFPSAMEQDELNELLQLKPRFDQASDSIAFPAWYLDRPTVRSYDDLDNLFALFPFDLLPPDYGPNVLSELVKAALHSAISRGTKLADTRRLARMFNFSEATFRRRLAAEGTSLVRLRQECREELAMNLLSSPELTMNEIAARLQFNDAATFRRAFRSWKGHSPSQARLGVQRGSSLPA